MQYPNRKEVAMANDVDGPAPSQTITEYPLGTSRPPLGVADLPEPEEVFKVSRIGALQIIQFVIGPSLIALGISIGSGEWLLGPSAVGEFGFVGVGWGSNRFGGARTVQNRRGLR